MLNGVQYVHVFRICTAEAGKFDTPIFCTKFFSVLPSSCLIGTQESMKIMGLNNWLHWTAWYLKYALFLFISVVFITLLYKINIGSHGAVINNSSASLLLLFFFLYSLVIIAQCFAVSVVFSTGDKAMHSYIIVC